MKKNGKNTRNLDLTYKPKTSDELKKAGSGGKLDLTYKHEIPGSKSLFRRVTSYLVGVLGDVGDIIDNGIEKISHRKDSQIIKKGGKYSIRYRRGSKWLGDGIDEIELTTFAKYDYVKRFLRGLDGKGHVFWVQEGGENKFIRENGGEITEFEYDDNKEFGDFFNDEDGFIVKVGDKKGIMKLCWDEGYEDFFLQPVLWVEYDDIKRIKGEDFLDLYHGQELFEAKKTDGETLILHCDGQIIDKR